MSPIIGDRGAGSHYLQGQLVRKNRRCCTKLMQQCLVRARRASSSSSTCKGTARVTTLGPAAPAQLLQARHLWQPTVPVSTATTSGGQGIQINPLDRGKPRKNAIFSLIYFKISRRTPRITVPIVQNQARGAHQPRGYRGTDQAPTLTTQTSRLHVVSFGCRARANGGARDRDGCDHPDNEGRGGEAW